MVDSISRTNSNTSIASGAAIPENFYCPISYSVMRDPVTTEHGQTFDRAWIKPVIDGGQPCPMTRRRFETGALTPNKELKRAIASHPGAASEACDAENPPTVLPNAQPRLQPSVRTSILAAFGELDEAMQRHERSSTRGGLAMARLSGGARSVAMQAQAGDTIGHRFLWGNAAGQAHARLSRANLIDKIDAAKQQLRSLKATGARLETRARLAGRICELQTYLAFARSASPVTTALDVAFGTYTAPANEPYAWRRAGVVGSMLWASAVMGGPVSGVIAQGTSMVGAVAKRSVRLAAHAPAKMANRMGRYNYSRNEGS